MELKKPFSLKSRLGQAVMEYLLLFVVIIIGIVVGGPFLIRSVQGHYKLLEESTQDSLSEDIQPARITGDVYPACSCDPHSSNPRDWPGYQCGGSAAAPGCAPTERYRHRLCHPMRCDHENACVWDADCCTAPLALNCGLKAPSQCPSRAIPNSHFPTTGTPIFTGTCMNAAGLDTEDCSLGERRYKIECGDPGGVIAHYACVTDHTYCLPVCWETPQAKTVKCDAAYPESNYDSPVTQSNVSRLALINGFESRLVSSPPHPYSFYQAIQDVRRVNGVQMHYKYIINPASCNPNNCERVCRSGYFPNASNTSCLKAFCWHWIHNNNACSLTTFPTFCTGNTCSYIAACVNSSGNVIALGGDGSFTKLVAGSCAITDNITYFNGHTYCYSFSSNTFPLSIPGQFSCDNNYLFFTSEGCS